MVGCSNKKDFVALQRFLSDFKIIQLTSEISNKTVELFKKYRLSHGVLIPDMLIAATALVTDVTLCSKNKKDFQFIEGLKLRVYEA